MGSFVDNKETIENFDSQKEITVSQTEIADQEVKKSSGEIVSAENVCEIQTPDVSEEKMSEIERDDSQKEITEIDQEVKIAAEKEDENVRLNEIPAVSEERKSEVDVKLSECERNYRVVFVLGGPGGGKSTQCANISKQIGFTHLSSGDLLRKAVQNDPEHGPMIQRMIKEGESVPPELTMVILMKAIERSDNDKFMLDGFPRDEEIRVAFEAATKTEPELVLFFDCSEEEREKRILSRNQGRVDDNPESIRKRFKYFEEHTLPVVEYYRSRGKVYQIDASKTKEEVSETITSLLTKTVAHVQAETEEIEVELEKDISKMKL
ncbi:UMP-CMP kinase 3-like [Euphorbia lathyris]|uniref:UMP-CMP kinase 3-like n=1 Tax=Euphorbia lathyris TaxID=212925 RepID=UPI0033141B81